MFRLFVSLAITLLSLVFAPGRSLSQETEHLLNAVIREKGAAWVAGRTSVSHLSAEEKKKLASFKPPASPTERLSVVRVPLAQAPAQFDWRNHNGGNYITPVRDQKTCGSCWAFSVTAVLESKLLVAARMPGGDIDLAEQFLVSCDTNDNGCSGGNTYYAASFLRDTGIPPEACYPYIDSNGVCGNACSDWSRKVYRITEYHTVAGSVEEIKDAVYTLGPVSSVLQIYDDFLYYRSGVYKHVSGSEIGSHAVTVVGWDDTGQYFIAKNSWGTDWGEAGFFRIAYGEVSSSTLFGSWSVALGDVIPPSVSPLVSPGVLDFETLVLPDTTSKSLKVSLANVGSSTLTNISLTTTAQCFSVSPSVLPALPPGAVQEAVIVYTPSVAPGGSDVDRGTLEIMCGGVTDIVPLSGSSNTRPRQPVNMAPTTGAHDVPLSPVLSATPFQDQDGDGHAASRWIVQNPEEGIVYATRIRRADGSYSDFDTINKEMLGLPSGVLKANTTYFWQVIYLDDRGAVSTPSDLTPFVTASPEAGLSPEAAATAESGGGRRMFHSDRGIRRHLGMAGQSAQPIQGRLPHDECAGKTNRKAVLPGLTPRSRIRRTACGDPAHVPDNSDTPGVWDNLPLHFTAGRHSRGRAVPGSSAFNAL